MQAARRIYVYLMSGISLGALVTGLTMLLAVLLAQVGLGTAGEVIGGGDDTLRQQLTVATALTVVSLPVWLIHWFAAERTVRPDRPGGLLELNAPERGLYFALALAVLLLVAAISLAAAIQGIVVRLADGGALNDVAGDLGRGAVALAFWGYHIRIRSRDWERRTLTHQAAFLPRTYRYGAAVVGLLAMLFALARLLELLGRVILDVPALDPGDGAAWWTFPLAEGLSGALVGGAVWLGHWAHATALVADPGPRGESERRSRLRLGAFVVVIVATAAATLGFLGSGIGAGLQLLLGVEDLPSRAEAVGSVAVPIASAALFAVAWWLHSAWLDHEPVARASADGAATVDRLRLYPVALVGLAFGAVGTAWLIGILLDALFGAPAIGGEPVRSSQLAQFAPYALVGWTVWTWRWIAIVGRSTADPVGEAASTTRRAMSLIALAVSVLAGIGAAGTILYRLFGSLFGIELPGSTIAELSLPIGILLVASGVGIGHGLLLRRDGNLRPDGEDADAAAVAGRPRTLRLRLSGPADGFDAALAALGSVTPPGYALDIEPEAGVDR